MNCVTISWAKTFESKRHDPLNIRGLNKETQNTTLLMVMCYKARRLRGIIFSLEKVDAFQTSLFFFAVTDIDEKVNKYDGKLLISPSEVIWKVNTLTHFASDHTEQNCTIWRWVVVSRILKKMINGTFINEFGTEIDNREYVCTGSLASSNLP